MNQEEFNKGVIALAKAFHDLAVQASQKKEKNKKLKKLFKAQSIKEKKRVMIFISL